MERRWKGKDLYKVIPKYGQSKVAAFWKFCTKGIKASVKSIQFFKMKVPLCDWIISFIRTK